jgi:hypothetical protein
MPVFSSHLFQNIRKMIQAVKAGMIPQIQMILFERINHSSMCTNAMLSWQLAVQTSETDRTTFTFSRDTGHAPWRVEDASCDDYFEEAVEESESGEAVCDVPEHNEEGKEGDSEEGSEYESV